MEKNFESIAELVQDPQFVKFVNDGLNELCKKRSSRPEPKPGYRYVRDWYDRMTDARQLKASFFLANIEDIWNKQSNLNRETRQIIQHVCDTSLYNTNIFYASLNDPEKDDEKPEPKKKGGRKKVVVVGAEAAIKP